MQRPVFCTVGYGVQSAYLRMCRKAGCPFYKPAGCEDWIKVEHNGEAWILTPEEYYGEV